MVLEKINLLLYLVTKLPSLSVNLPRTIIIKSIFRINSTDADYIKNIMSINIR